MRVMSMYNPDTVCPWPSKVPWKLLLLSLLLPMGVQEVPPLRFSPHTVDRSMLFISLALMEVLPPLTRAAKAARSSAVLIW